MRRRNEKLMGEFKKMKKENEAGKEEIKQLMKLHEKLSEKEKLCQDLQASCSLLEDRLKTASQSACEGDQHTTVLSEKLEDTERKLRDKESLMRDISEELTNQKKEVRSLKDALSAESERQLNEFNSVIDERLEERNQQLAATGAKVKELNDIIMQKDEMYKTLKEESNSALHQSRSDLEKL
jgi:chromosome segregation ATPase